MCDQVSEAVTLLEYETSQGSSSRSEEEGPENEDLAHDMFNRCLTGIHTRMHTHMPAAFRSPDARRR